MQVIGAVSTGKGTLGRDVWRACVDGHERDPAEQGEILPDLCTGDFGRYRFIGPRGADRGKLPIGNLLRGVLVMATIDPFQTPSAGSDAGKPEDTGPPAIADPGPLGLPPSR